MADTAGMIMNQTCNVMIACFLSRPAAPLLVLLLQLLLAAVAVVVVCGFGVFCFMPSQHSGHVTQLGTSGRGMHSVWPSRLSILLRKDW